MFVRRVQLALLVAAICAGCAGPRFPTIAPASDEDRAEADMPFVCTNAEHCVLAWRKAQFWVANTADTKIQIATDTIIQTYNTSNEVVRGWAFKATREPGRDGRDTIDLVAVCRGMDECSTNPMVMVARFKRYLRAAQ